MRDNKGRFVKGHICLKGSEKGWFKKGQRKPKNSYKFEEGENHPNWKGGRFLDGSGYVHVIAPHHPFKNNHGYIFEHRLVMEFILGRYLLPSEVVHHRGIHFPVGTIKNIQDNSPENLQLFKNNSEHAKSHNTRRKDENES